MGEGGKESEGEIERKNGEERVGRSRLGQQGEECEGAGGGAGGGAGADAAVADEAEHEDEQHRRVPARLFMTIRTTATTVIGALFITTRTVQYHSNRHWWQ